MVIAQQGAAAVPTGSTNPFTSLSFGASQHSHQQHAPSPQVQLQLLQDRLTQERKGWQLQRWEYEAQIRDLEAQLAEVRAEPCGECGAPSTSQRKAAAAAARDRNATQPPSIIDRPRMRSGSTIGANT